MEYLPGIHEFYVQSSELGKLQQSKNQKWVSRGRNLGAGRLWFLGQIGPHSEFYSANPGLEVVEFEVTSHPHRLRTSSTWKSALSCSETTRVTLQMALLSFPSFSCKDKTKQDTEKSKCQSRDRARPILTAVILLSNAVCWNALLIPCQGQFGNVVMEDSGSCSWQPPFYYAWGDRHTAATWSW